MKNYVRFLLALAQRSPVSETPSNSLSTRAVADLGCYALDTTDPQTLTFNTPAACSEECEDQGHTVFAVRGMSCMCLDSMPSDDKNEDASKCAVQCPGFPTEICGGAERGYYSVGEIDTFTNTTTTNTSSADADSSTYSATLTATQTTLPTSSGAASDSTSSASSSVATPTGSASSSSASGSSASDSSASPSSTVESTSAAGPMFDTSLTAVSSLVGAVALLAALI